MIDATYESDCDYCDELIEEGDSITHLDSWGWIHTDCADEAMETQP